MTPEEIWESIRLSKKLPDIVNKIFNDYNTTSEIGIKAALGQAVWVGICEGKEWIDNE